MKAAIRRRYGSIDDLKIETLSRPVPKKNQVLIKVYATTVNRTDYAVLTGKPYIMRFFTGLFAPTLPVPGTDFAGIIEEVGEDAGDFKINERVFGFNDQALGSQAEYMVLSKDEAISTIPDNISFAQAAASLEGAHYAFNFVNNLTLQPGNRILLNGASGGIGSALLQFLKYYNTHVTAVCNTKNIELIRSLGADKIYDYTKEDFTKDKEQYDFVFDAVGKSTFAKCKPMLKPGGVYISSELGPSNENPILAITTKLMGSKKVIFPIPSNIKRSMEFIKKLTSEGKFKPVIDKVYSLDNIAEAYKYVASGEKTGNVIISIAEQPGN